MSLSGKIRQYLAIALGDAGAAKELADGVDQGPPGGFTTAVAHTGAETHTGAEVHTGLEDFGRTKASQGTAHAVGGTDFALSGGFGTTASVAVAAGSNDQRGRATITSAGTGQGANPTCTLTFKDGAWAAAPFAVICRGGGSQRGVQFDVSVTTTTMVLTFIGTPVAAETYIIDWMVEG